MYKFRFSFTTSAGEYSVFNLKAKNYTEANLKAREWCEKAKCTFSTITRVNN